MMITNVRSPWDVHLNQDVVATLVLLSERSEQLEKLNNN